MHAYTMIMSPDHNPLARLPPAQKFQLMLGLSVMWTLIFTASLGAWAWYGVLLAAHVLIPLGAVLTWLAFRNASKATYSKTYRDHPAADGTARYDDVWGA